MKTVEYALFCDHVSVSMDNKVSLMGIFDRIFARKTPARHPRMFTVAKLNLPKGNHQMTLALMQEDRVVAKTKLIKKVEHELLGHTHVWELKNILIQDFNSLELQIFIGGRQVYIKTLPVVKPRTQGIRPLQTT
ncbi:MAG: hypothetical protein AAB802_04660 [Patescibacteria group bacterium]